MRKPSTKIAGREAAIERGAKTDAPIWASTLSDREYIFVEHYLQTLQLNEAALAAGYSKSSAPKMAWDLIRKPHIREAIDVALQERFNTSKASIIEKIAQMAFFNPGNVLSWDDKGLKVKSSNKLNAADWAGIEGVKMNKDGSIEVKFVDRLAALEKLARLSGIARELTPPDVGNYVTFVIGDPDGVLERHRAEQAKRLQASEMIDITSVPGTHTDLVIGDPKK